eukprot:15062487-Alexandrium_andersonii.AAC.1
MSASLVGSEMCIRDSRNATRSLSSRYTCSIPLRELPGTGRLARMARQPVSYTHLTLPTICSV